MAQYDVYRNPSQRTQRAIPLLLAVQHDGTSETASVVMVPLVVPLKAKRHSRLYPLFSIAGKEYMLLTPDLASLPREPCYASQSLLSWAKGTGSSPRWISCSSVADCRHQTRSRKKVFA